MSCVRGERLVLDHVSFTCEAASPLIVRGPNGAGKSTLLRAVAGFVRLRHGSIRLSGVKDAKNNEVDREHIHYLGHTDGVKSVLSIRENLSFWASLLGGGGGAQSIERALTVFDLTNAADLPVEYLSAGQRRRVALARLVVAERPLWLLDEPGTALDSGAMASLSTLMSAHCESGGLLIVAAHDAFDIPGAQVLELAL